MSTASPAHLPPLGTHAREAVAGELQAMLVELIDLSLIGKQLHWSLGGPLGSIPAAAPRRAGRVLP